MKLIVIKNRGAGKGRIFSEEADLESIFRKYRIEAEIIEANGRSIKREITDAAKKHPDIITVSGGDGSISSAAQILTGGDIPLGIIPSGTLNHFAKDAGIPLNAEEAVKCLIDMNVTKVDVGEVNGRYFVNNSSVGIYPKAVKHRDKHMKEYGSSKWMAMGRALLTVFKRMPRINVKIKSDMKNVHCSTPVVFIGNNEYKTDLFNAGVRHSLNEGKLSLFYPTWTGRFTLIRYFFLALLNKLKEEKDFHTLITEEILIETDRKELEVAVDGEVIHLITPLNYTIHPSALKIIVPRKE